MGGRLKYSMNELMPVVKMLSEKYTSKESTSIPYEKAVQLMGAVLYCISQNDVKLPVSAQGKPNAMLMYQRGYERLIAKVHEAKKVYDQILDQFQDYGMECYRDTILKGMPQFFLYYDARFYPQEHLLTLDYPVAESLEHLQGINRIYAYLLCIQKEQRFLEKFPRGYVQEILREYHSDYEGLFESITQIIKEYH